MGRSFFVLDMLVGTYLWKHKYVVRSVLSLFFIPIFLLSGLLSPGPCATDSGTATEVRSVTKTLSGAVELCLDCHKERPDTAHGREVLGCSVCHRGDPLAGSMEAAHKGVVRNPGELRWVDQTCGQSGCHSKETGWVKNSLMATNRGIISTLRYYWGETDDHAEDISVEMLRTTGLDSPAVDYFRKLCGSCHLWMEKGSLPDFLARKGGGCTACHHLPADETLPKGERHPAIVRKIPMENCVRCHNRSGRIGLSYQGLYENEGYGLPLENGDFTERSLEDGRFVSVLPEDIHHQAGLVCTDCHTQREVMGDGTRHAHFEEQLEVTCRTCHGDVSMLDRIADQALREKAEMSRGDAPPAFPRLSVEKRDGAFALLGKNDGKPHALDPPDPIACAHPTHKRLSCSACHATWVPQCYGCHVKGDASRTQLDKISLRETPGRWQEFKGFMRHEAPPLGVLKDRHDMEEVVILVPG